MPNTPLQPGRRLHGFRVQRRTPLPAPDGVAIELCHERSGARVLHLCNDDPENLFSISFPTPPPDNTGVPHILEHSVLGGSKKYPARDPFFEMVKISLATFINAMTFWDRTVYPVASNVRQDLFNLAEVYFDAVFHPLLTEAIFRREGHHRLPAPATGALSVSGIVFNEMKGIFSNPEWRLEILAQRHLFPDSIYGRESGGDPEVIPDLTYGDFRRFYEEHYHPSQALFIFYGNIETPAYLAFLEERLAGYDARPRPSLPPRQPRWTKPRERIETYAVARNEPLTRRTYLLETWLAGDATRAEEAAELYILSLLLLGHEAAPLKRRLVDSGLGEDLIGAGADVVGMELVFRAGLKGSEAERAGPFADLVETVLREEAARPFSAESLAAAFQQAGYEYQEIVPGHPLRRLYNVLQSWSYGDDPLTYLRMRDVLRGLRERASADPMYFSRVIQTRLLENPHHLRLVLKPDPEHQAREDRQAAERLQQERARLTPPDLVRLAEEAARLQQESGTPNPPEVIQKLPQLRRSDLPNQPVSIPARMEVREGEIPLLRLEVPSNGVCYLELDVNVDGLNPGQWAYLPRYAEAFSKMGIKGQAYDVVARRKAACVGALGTRAWFQGRADDASTGVRRVRFILKTLDEHIEPALELLEDLLFSLDPSDEKRLHDIIIQARASARTDLIQAGSSTPLLHAGRGYSPEAYLRETTAGLPQLQQLETLGADFPQAASDLMARIEAIRGHLLVQGRWTAGFTGSDESLEAVRAALRRWSGRLARHPVGASRVDYPVWQSPVREGLAAPIQIAHCALVMPAPPYAVEDEPLLGLGAHLLTFDYVLPEVRLKGNAYGAGCQQDPLMKTLAFSSFRDPHVVRTFEVFEGALDFAKKAPWSQADLDRAIIGKARDELKPIRPADALPIALDRQLIGLTTERRTERYRRRLAAQPDDVRRALLRVLEAGRSTAVGCALAGREKLEEAARQRPDWRLQIEDIQTGA